MPLEQPITSEPQKPASSTESNESSAKTPEQLEERIKSLTPEQRKLFLERFNAKLEDAKKQGKLSSEFISDDGEVQTRKALDRLRMPAEATEEIFQDSETILPPRPTDAITGQQLVDEIKKMGDSNDLKAQSRMERRILEEFEKGNIPSFCRPENMKTFSMEKDGTRVEFQASLDYLAIGSDSNYIRIPITPRLAKTINEKYGLAIPTGPMTDAIYDQADVKLGGIGLVNNAADEAKMQGPEFIQKHNGIIEKQLENQQTLAKLRSGEIAVAGHKKDIIISRYAIDHPGSLDFRGLYINGKPIQTNPAHGEDYRDYSHGWRMVGAKVRIINPDGSIETKSYRDALKDQRVARVLNGAEGVIDADRAYRSKFEA